MLVFQKDYSQLARLEPLVLNLISLRLAFMVFFRVFSYGPPVLGGKRVVGQRCSKSNQKKSTAVIIHTT